MLAWLLTLPVLAAACAGLRVVLQRNPPLGFRWMQRLNAVLLLGAGVVVTLIAAAVPGATATATTPRAGAGAALLGAAIAITGSSIGVGLVVAFSSQIALRGRGGTERLGHSLTITSLAEGTALYGLVVAAILIGST